MRTVRDVDTVPVCQSDGSLAGTVSNRDIVAKVVAQGRDPRQVLLSELAEPMTCWGSMSMHPWTRPSR